MNILIILDSLQILTNDLIGAEFLRFKISIFSIKYYLLLAKIGTVYVKR